MQLDEFIFKDLNRDRCNDDQLTNLMVAVPAQKNIERLIPLWKFDVFFSTVSRGISLRSSDNTLFNDM